MAKQLQLRRGTTVQHSTFTGAVGEVTIDTDKDTVVVHDGSTAGGFPSQKELVSGTNIKTVNSTTLLGSGDIAVQATLVSGTNIKTINSTSLLGSGDVSVQPTLVSGTNIKTINSTSLLGSGDISVSDSTKLPLAGGTMTGAITSLKETKVAMAASNIDLSLGNLFTKTISGSTTLTVSNVPTTGTVGYLILELTNAGSATITWFSGVKWAGGTAPTLTSAGKDIISMYTHDAGTTWNVNSIQRDVK